MEDILQEISECVAVHKSCGTVLGGVHLEMSQGSITECLGGAMGITEEMLPLRYETYCDPRLNYGQSIEAAFAIASELEREGQKLKKSTTSLIVLFFAFRIG